LTSETKPTETNQPTAEPQESSIEEKTEKLCALLEGGAPKTEVEPLIDGWMLGEKSQVEAKLTPDQRQQLRDLVG
jgi:hypothetical protein